jgi:hypothetical protein
MSMASENFRKRKHSDVVAASPLDLLAGAEVARDQQQSQINSEGLIARGTPAGNVYSGLTLGGDTRAILGNVFYTTHNNVTSPSDRTAEEERREERGRAKEQRESLMNTLAFDRMDFRKATVEPAHTRTCQWITMDFFGSKATLDLASLL